MKRKSVFYLSDLALILLVILAVGGILWRFGFFRSGTGEDTVTYTVTAVCYDLDARTSDCLHEGDELHTAAGERFGTVTMLSKAPHEEHVTGNGERIAVRLPEGTREDVFLSVTLQGKTANGSVVRENGREILSGETYRLYTRFAAVDLFILSVLQ